MCRRRRQLVVKVGLVVLALAAGTAACGQASLEYLADVRVWPAYLPVGVEVEGDCFGEDGLVLMSPVKSGSPSVRIFMIRTVGELSVDALPAALASEIEGLVIERSTAIPIRRGEGITWQRTLAVSDDNPAPDNLVIGIAWSEGSNLFSIEGSGLDLGDLQRVAEGLEPSFSRWMGCL